MRNLRKKRPPPQCHGASKDHSRCKRNATSTVAHSLEQVWWFVAKHQRVFCTPHSKFIAGILTARRVPAEISMIMALIEAEIGIFYDDSFKGEGEYGPTSRSIPEVASAIEAAQR